MFPTSLAIRKMQIKTMVGYHFTPQTKGLLIKPVDKNVVKLGLSDLAARSKMLKSLWKTARHFLTKSSLRALRDGQLRSQGHLRCTSSSVPGDIERASWSPVCNGPSDVGPTPLNRRRSCDIAHLGGAAMTTGDTGVDFLALH